MGMRLAAKTDHYIDYANPRGPFIHSRMMMNLYHRNCPPMKYWLTIFAAIAAIPLHNSSPGKPGMGHTICL